MKIAPDASVANRYRIKSFIDKGGMQEVWVARDMSLDRDVAVKTPIIDGARKRFASSAQLSARVRHSNVASALDYIRDGEDEFFVEELIVGINLQKCVDRFFPRLDGDTAAHVLHHLAKGLAASHAVGVLHRDLKPSNIMVSSDLSFSQMKITDFGIAKLAEDVMDRDTAAIDAGNTQGISSTMLGAIPFLAPEVLRKNKAGAPPIGRKSDVWSLGAIGYWLLSGDYPFGTSFDAVPGIFSGVPSPWSPLLTTYSLTAELVKRLQKIIISCFALSPDDRPSAEQLVDAIGQLGYISSGRECGVVTDKGPYGGVWWGRSDSGKPLMLHQAEVVAGGNLKTGARVNFVSTPGTPNRRAFAILKLKDQPSAAPRVG